MTCLFAIIFSKFEKKKFFFQKTFFSKNNNTRMATKMPYDVTCFDHRTMSFYSFFNANRLIRYYFKILSKLFGLIKNFFEIFDKYLQNKIYVKLITSNRYKITKNDKISKN